MAFIKAPYNFVPLNKIVVTPYWANYISQDIPFEEPQSGCLKITLTTHSPIFIKNGLPEEVEKTYFSWDDEGKKIAQVKPFEFNQDATGRYFIPGSSLKGMVRNVLEVMSFGRMDNQVNDVQYFVRDFHNNDLYNVSKIAQSVSCGWLYKEGGQYKINDCGKPLRISHKNLDKIFNTKMAYFFSNQDKLDEETDSKFAKFKYENYDIDTSKTYFFEKVVIKKKTSYELSLEPTNISGRIVMTGHPSTLKKKEFIFEESNRVLEVGDRDSSLINNFLLAYNDQDIKTMSPDWEYWKPKLKDGEKIPIFFRKVKKYDKEKGKHFTIVEDMGLSMLYKFMYKYSVKSSIENTQTNIDYDLAEAMFGYITKEEEDKKHLKGRIHFSHAFVDKESKKPEEDTPKTVALASPKASYYPTYIRQEIKNGKVKRYKTFMDDDHEIAGRKRYPIRTGGKVIENRPEDATEKVLTKFIPLKAKVTFSFKIRYHNLKKIELGALISALTFHQTADTFHSLGMAKALGYGKVDLQLTDTDIENIEEYLCCFEAYMNKELQGKEDTKWHKTEQITELIAMVSDQKNTSNSSSELAYMNLDVSGKDNPFNEAKKEKKALDRYSTLVNSTKTIKSLCSDADIANISKTIQQELTQFKQLNAKQQEGDTTYKESLRSLLQKRKIQVIEERLHEKEIREKEESLRKKIITQEQARETGLKDKLASFKHKDRKAWDNLKKLVEKYVRALNKNMQYDTVVKENGIPVLLETDIADILATLSDLFIENKQAQKKLTKNKSIVITKVSEWVGASIAEDFFKKLG